MTPHMFDLLVAMANGGTMYRREDGKADCGRRRASAGELDTMRRNGWIQIRQETYVLTYRGRAAVTLAD